MQRRRMAWSTTGPLSSQCQLMGIVNVTPDSFSDGGLYTSSTLAIEHAQKLIADGAAIVDIGGESTRPGSDPVSEDEELARVIPVVQGLRAVSDVPISVDTTKSTVAEAAIEAGADIVNDISSGRDDSRLLDVVRFNGAGLVLMHMRGRPKTMQLGDLSSPDIVAEVLTFLEKRIDVALKCGISEQQICVDPGLGFGKTVAQNFSLCRSLRKIRKLGRPVLFGISRKSCLGSITGRPPSERDAASIAAQLWAVTLGASMLRVHNVAQMNDALKVWQALE